MKQYLLSIYQPDGPTPPPEFLDQVMRDVDALIAETKSAGAWVFNGSLHAPSTATVVRLQGDDVLISRAMTYSSPTARSPRARSTSAGS
jgi:hypothetical protein